MRVMLAVATLATTTSCADADGVRTPDSVYSSEALDAFVALGDHRAVLDLVDAVGSNDLETTERDRVLGRLTEILCASGNAPWSRTGAHCLRLAASDSPGLLFDICWELGDYDGCRELVGDPAGFEDELGVLLRPERIRRVRTSERLRFEHCASLANVEENGVLGSNVAPGFEWRQGRLEFRQAFPPSADDSYAHVRMPLPDEARSFRLWFRIRVTRQSWRTDLFLGVVQRSTDEAMSLGCRVESKGRRLTAPSSPALDGTGSQNAVSIVLNGRGGRPIYGHWEYSRRGLMQETTYEVDLHYLDSLELARMFVRNCATGVGCHDLWRVDGPVAGGLASPLDLLISFTKPGEEDPRSSRDNDVVLEALELHVSSQ